jgi:YggT family protein
MNAIVWLIVTVIDLYFWIIIAAAILSWLVAFNVVNPRNQFVATIGETLYRLTEPALAPIRRFMPNLGGIDISPVILLLLLGFLKILILDLTAGIR